MSGKRVGAPCEPMLLIGFGLARYGEYFRMHTVLAGLRPQ
jgi:hypothetical protein